MPAALILHVVTLVNLYFLLLTLYNIRYLHFHSFRAMLHPQPALEPRVSVILPVRNEEARIKACLDSLLDQAYGNYEIIVVDDGSEDATAAILKGYETEGSRLKLLTGRPLEPGWNGKSFACSQAAAVATGDYLFFTDADTVHDPESISWAVRNLRDNDADFLSAYVRQRLGSLGELLVVPVIFIMTALLLPLGLIPRRNSPNISFAIGQLMLCRRDAFLAIGGYSRFKGSVVEDLSLARELKRSGFKTIFLDAKGHVTCRMYESFREAMRGIGKSLFGAINSSLILLAVLMSLILFAIEYPFYTAFTGVIAGGPVLSPVTLPVMLFTLAWLAKLHNRRMPVLAVILYPLTFFCLILLGLYSAAKTGFGAGLEWKGRLVVADARRVRARKEAIRIADLRPRYLLVADAVFLLTLALVYLFAKLVLGLQIAGRENLPRDRGRPVLLISNHVLYLDGAMIACAIFPRRTFFSALEETFAMPFVGHYIRLLGAFPLPRKDTLRQIMEPMSRMFAMGRFVHFFPEGELVRRSSEIRDLKLGVFLLAVRFDALVIPVTLTFRRRPRLASIFPDAFGVRIVIQEPIDSRDYLRRGRGRSQAIRELAEDARSAMERALRAESREGLATG